MKEILVNNLQEEDETSNTGCGSKIWNNFKNVIFLSIPNLC